MNNRDSDKTIHHKPGEKTIGPQAVPQAENASAGKSGASAREPNRTIGGDKTVMFPSSAEGATLRQAGRDESRRAIPDVAGYEILEELGRGGMGVVYKARNRELNRIVALKMILSGAHASEETILRFRSEAEAVAQLHHPNIVQVFDVGQCSGQPWCALEFVDGESLDQMLESGELQARESAALVEQLARAMQSAHATGIVHRDLKPANILMGRSAGSSLDVRASDALFPKITDFGLAKRVEQEASQTQTGAIVGTPGYMSPEQARGVSRIGPAADIYALGAILYRLMTGRPPFSAETPIKTVMQVISAEPAAPSVIRPGVDRDLATICMKCLEKDPGRRYASAEHLAQDLARYLAGEPIQARPVSAIERVGKWVRRKPWAAAVLALLVLGLVGTAVGGAVFNSRISTAYQQIQLEQQRALLALESENVAKNEALEAGHRAEQSAAESLRRLIDNYVSNGLQLLEQNQPMLALPWFAEAIKTDPDPARSRIHLLRFDGARQRCPQVLDTWLTDSAVTRVKLNREGTEALAATGSRQLVIRDMASKTIRKQIELDGQVVYLDANDDFSRILAITVRLDGTISDYQNQVFEIQFWDGNSGSPTGPGLRFPVDLTAAKNGNAISMKSGKLARLNHSGDTRFGLFDLASGATIAEVAAHGAIREVRFNPAGSRLMVLSDRIQVWDFSRDEWIWESDFESSAINGSLIAFGDGTLVIQHDTTWAIDLDQGKVINLPQVSGDPVAVAVSADGSRLVFARAGGGVDIRDEAGQLVHTVELGAQPGDFVFSQNGEILLIAAGNRVFRVDLRSGRLLGAPIPATVSPLNDANTNADGSRIVTGGGNGILDGQGAMRVWSCEPASTTRPIMPLAATENPVSQVPVLSADGQFVAVYDGLTTSPAVFRLNARLDGEKSGQGGIGESGNEWLTPLDWKSDGPGNACLVNQVAFLPDSKSLLVAHSNGDVSIHAIDSGQRQTAFSLGEPARSIRFSPSGERVAIATGDGPVKIRVFSTANGEQIGTGLECPQRLMEMAFTADEGSLVAVSRDLAIRCWSIPASELQWNKFAGLILSDVAISEARDMIALGGGRLGGLPGRVELLKLSTGEEWIPPIDLTDEIQMVRICASDDAFLIAEGNGTVEIRSLADGQLIAPPINHPDQVTSIALRNDNELLLTVCRDRQVRVYDRQTGLLITSWDFRDHPVTTASFVPDQPMVVVGGGTGMLCELPHALHDREEAINASVFMSASEVSEQGVLLPASRERIARALGVEAGVSTIDVTSNLPKAGTAGKSETSAAFFDLLTPEMRTSFPGLAVPVAPTRPLRLSYQFKAGESRQYESISTTELDTMGIASKQTDRTVVDCRCDRVTESGFSITASIVSAATSMTTPGGSYSVNSLKPEEDRAAPVFQPLLEIMHVTHSALSDYDVSTFGEIPDYRPPSAIREAVQASPQARSMSISPESLSIHYVSMWTNLPDGELVVGDQWPAEVVAGIFKPEEIEAVATFLGVATINGRAMAVIRVRATAGGRPYDAPIFDRMDSASDSVVYFDIEKGCVDSSFTNSLATMKLKINNINLEQKIDGRTEIRLVQ